MADDPRRASLLVMAKMALADGQVTPEEKGMFSSLAGAERVDALLDEARQGTLDELVGRVAKYEDRFFIALRSYMMAHVDGDFDVKEEKLYERLVEKLGVTDADRKLIRKTEAAQRAVRPTPPDPRIDALYEASSFFQAE